MPRLDIIEEATATQGDFSISVTFIRLDQSYLLLITDQPEYGIGTVTISAPPSELFQDAMSSPFSLFGLKNPLISNLIGKTASKKLKVPVLSLILLKSQDIKPDIILKVTMDAVNCAILKIQNNETK